MQHQQQQVAIVKHQSVFEPRQMQSFRHHAEAAAGASADDGEEHPPPLPVKKRHSKLGLGIGRGFMGGCSYWNLILGIRV